MKNVTGDVKPRLHAATGYRLSLTQERRQQNQMQQDLADGLHSPVRLGRQSVASLGRPSHCIVDTLYCTALHRVDSARLDTPPLHSGMELGKGR